MQVYRLVSRGTVEELILDRQVWKQQQAAMALTDDDQERLFDGVRGHSSDELWGFSNLLKTNVERASGHRNGSAWADEEASRVILMDPFGIEITNDGMGDELVNIECGEQAIVSDHGDDVKDDPSPKKRRTPVEKNPKKSKKVCRLDVAPVDPNGRVTLSLKEIASLRAQSGRSEAHTTRTKAEVKSSHQGVAEEPPPS